MKIQKFLITLISSTFLYSAAAGGLAADLPYELTPFSFEGQAAFAQAKGITDIPVVVHFEKGGQECLRYIAAAHAAGPVPSDKEPGHPTFAAIKQAFEEFKPDFCIIEGCDGKEGTLFRQQHCDSAELKDTPGSESSYTAQLSKERGIPFVGGEPTRADILSHVLKNEVSKDDYACLLITQVISQSYRDYKGAWENPDAYLETFINAQALWLELATGKKYTFAEYKSWIEKNYGSFCFEELADSDATSPVINGTRLQQVASVVEALRDPEILSRIIMATEKYKKVLVVYGCSHYYTQHKELERRFGQPMYETFKP